MGQCEKGVGFSHTSIANELGQLKLMVQKRIDIDLIKSKLQQTDTLLSH